MDLVLLSSDASLLLGVVEFKTGTGDISNKTTMDHIRQVLSYSIGPLAYSRWGACGETGAIVSLLLYPCRIYRLTLNKPKRDDAERPFVLSLEIETTEDACTMCSVLEDYLRSYSAAYRTSERKSVHVNPRDWTPLNIDFEYIGDNFGEPSLGFLFKTTGNKIMEMILRDDLIPPDDINKSIFVTDVMKEGTVIVKYLSSLLDLDFMVSYKTVTAILSKIRTEAERVRFQSETVRLQSENEKLIALLKASPAEPSSLISSTGGSGSVLQVAAATSLNSSTGDSGSASQVAAATFSPISPSAPCDIFHPYLGTVRIDTGHPLLIMRDMGRSLLKAVEDREFLISWREESKVRRKFFVEVCMSGLNIVKICNVCHNDIRLANITVRTSRGAASMAADEADIEADNMFCLIDFDMSDEDVTLHARRSRVLMGLERRRTQSLMMYTVAQIALVVFKLDSLSEHTGAGADHAESQGDKGDLDMMSVRRFWLTEEGLNETTNSFGKFDVWLRSRELKDIFPDVPGTRSVECGLMDWNFFAKLLKAVVGLK